jgi:hypothetical protein
MVRKEESSPSAFLTWPDKESEVRRCSGTECSLRRAHRIGIDGGDDLTA